MAMTCASPKYRLAVASPTRGLFYEPTAIYDPAQVPCPDHLHG